ncbi:toll/interleukin-1 receptor domain-containing protein [Saccharothrix sp. NRRL B-16314]|uniref:toll/interleukin-1 receptor domain-containing protein n=1 Tax=Saccharothrix sp. NRRL B-16314 TaxID=1463825 RepID=UPI0005251947|nr:toll/interleukin-1 receptor domain-containing protein [Saccharothrix sp. NRRL B-16314]
MAGVFVSYRAGDEARATRLAEELRARGHDVWLDTWEVAVGDSIVAKMDEGLVDCSYLVVCFSSQGWSGPWMNREWMSALARQMHGERVRILPVRLTGGTAPAILADLKHADLVADWSRGVDQLCAAIG